MATQITKAEFMKKYTSYEISELTDYDGKKYGRTSTGIVYYMIL